MRYQKCAVRTAISAVVLTVLLVCAASGYFMYSIGHYSRITLKHIYATPRKLIWFNLLPNENTPHDFGFSYSAESFTSQPSGLHLQGWFIPSKSRNDECILFVHGRWDNRLKPMKYLEMIRNAELDGRYAVFLPDLRNSGESDESSTMMGYDFAEDIASAMVHCRKKYGMRRFVLYAFSQGAMGAAVAYNGRADIGEYMRREDVHIEKMIFDSPMTDATENLAELAAGFAGTPRAVTRVLVRIYAYTVPFDWKILSVRTLLQGSDLPVLILQSKADTMTPFSVIEKQLPYYGKNIRTEFFEKGEHVMLYREKENRKRYVDAVNNFLRK